MTGLLHLPLPRSPERHDFAQTLPSVKQKGTWSKEQSQVSWEIKESNADKGEKELIRKS
jgi:hypothetical protein